jgi:hypothetical protein
MSNIESSIRRLEIAKRLIGGEKRAQVAKETRLTRAKVRDLANEGIRICQLYADPPVTHHITMTDARAEKDKFIAAIDAAILGNYLRGNI